MYHFMESSLYDMRTPGEQFTLIMYEDFFTDVVSTVSKWDEDNRESRMSTE
jgi:hypothetical protein